MWCEPSPLYDPSTAVAQLARDRDLAWFDAHPRATWRVRPALEGESRFLDGMRDTGGASRAYVIAIHHARARDRRAEVTLGTYPVLAMTGDRGRARLYLAREGERWARWFRKSAATPPATRRAAMLARVG